MKMLIISSNFGLNGVPSSHHIDDRVMELTKRNVEVTIVTERPPNNLSILAEGKVKIHIIGSEQNLRDRVIANIDSLVLSKVINKLIHLINVLLTKARWGKNRFANWSWEKAATSYILNNINVSHFDLIYSTGGPAVAHLVAHSVAAHFNSKWVAEIQDPLIFGEIRGPSYKATKTDLRKLKRAESVLKGSDFLVCLTASCMNLYKSKLEITKIDFIYPGSNINEVTIYRNKTHKNKGNEITFFHAGTLGAERNLNVLIDAIIGANLQKRIKIKIAGHVAPEVHCKIKSQTFIEYLGFIPREEVKRNILYNDICLVIQNTGSISKYTIPSKFYEYTALRKPTLFLGYSNNEVETNSGHYNFYYADQKAIESVIKALKNIIEDYPDNLKVPITVGADNAIKEFLDICYDVINSN